MYFVYILRTSKNTLYTGQTNNLERRMREHSEKLGRGAKYMRAFDSFELVYKESLETRGEALKREAKLKKLTRVKKELLLNQIS